MEKANTSLQLSIPQDVRLVSTVRRFAGEFYGRVLVDQDLTARLTIATHELLENAVAYSSDGDARISIEIQDETLVLETWNRSSRIRLAMVKAAIAEMVDSDPAEYYQESMVKTATRTEGSGLGLARIRAEAEMDLTCEVDEDWVCIRATAQIVGGIHK